jgi:hypothetical protein
MRYLVLLAAALASPLAWAAPPASTPSRRPASAPLTDEPGAPRAAHEARATEFRFDALRIDGALRGPEALVVDSSLSRAGKSLTRLRRSFVHRVFDTVEAPGLHGGH